MFLRGFSRQHVAIKPTYETEKFNAHLKQRKLLKRRKTESDQVVIDFSHESDRSRGWREYPRPIMLHSEVKPVQSHIAFDIQLKMEKW